MSDFKNSTLRDHALDIQAQTGVKYTEALRQATRDIHVVDNSVEDYSDPVAWADDPDYYKMLTTFDTLAVELLDVLPKLHTVLGEPWLLTREESDSCHINPRTDVCYCFDVALVSEKDRYSKGYVAHESEALSPRLYKAVPTSNFGAYEAQAQMVGLKEATHSRIYFESNWDIREYVYDFTGLSLDEKKTALVELFNVTLREVILDHLSRCVEETKWRNDADSAARTVKELGLDALNKSGKATLDKLIKNKNRTK